MTAIKITIGELDMIADLNDTPTAEAIIKILPIEGPASIWGDEIYFGIDVSMEEDEGARASLSIGELAYWPPGGAFCIFWGETPASKSPSDIRAASEVNPIGRLRAIPVMDLGNVEMGETVTVELIEESEIPGMSGVPADDPAEDPAGEPAEEPADEPAEE